MGSTSDKISGLTNEAIGNVKQGVGKAVGNEKLQAEGAAQELKGETQQAVGDAKSAVKDGADKLSDTAHRKL
ncbi:CsbD family protein [Tianweitania sp. BSSL-BM11]|uniref:CsbD family protein n=1 Tax=Tianweitania aestuarii TaxID=2814886 RepID=A0ABS5RSW1_9HYPH|nr:CsbD family protein [Tianweitania aestuarii]MBS9720148.1 CsbD family protein [Tianweitania aestuarii]